MAIPSTAESWRRRLDGQERDLYLAISREPPLALLERLQKAMRLAEKARCRVIRELTLSNLRSLFVDQEVVTIIAHGREDGCIELNDKMVTPDAFVEQVPDQFSGCVHLCGCHSDVLGDTRAAKASPKLARDLQRVSREATIWCAVMVAIVVGFAQCQKGSEDGSIRRFLRLHRQIHDPSPAASDAVRDYCADLEQRCSPAREE